MTFVEMRDKLREHFAEMTKNNEPLFFVNLDKMFMWELYLDSFPEGTNEIYRERRYHDCACCRHFIKTVGNAVTLVDNKPVTIWDVELGDDVFQPVFNALAEYVKSYPISDIYYTKEQRIGTPENYENIGGDIHTWNHFYLDLPTYVVNKTNRSNEELKAVIRDRKNVFKRSLDELTTDSIKLVLELIASNSIYRGEEWKFALTEFLKYKEEYSEIPDDEKANWTWLKAVTMSDVVAKIRNHSMGTLLVDISNGESLDVAVTKYEKIVAPENYKRPKGLYTQKQLDALKKDIVDGGYMDFLTRRHANLDDINVRNILFSNKDSAKRIVGGEDIFAQMAKGTKSSVKKFSKVEEIGIEKFIADVLPTVAEVEAYVENKHIVNMVSLIAPVNPEAKSMLKWDNPFSWAYAGNMADSSMKERVKYAGGNVDGDLRFSIQWNDLGVYNGNDFDAHCHEPNGYEIFFGNRDRKSPSKGTLDVDIIQPFKNVPAVENIIYVNKHDMKDGEYHMFVHCYNNRGGKDGFKAEVEFDGVIHTFEYRKPVKNGEKITVAKVTLKNGEFTIKGDFETFANSKEVWGIKTNDFVPVSTIMFSPNYWNEQEGIGNKHYFFMLKDCVNPENPNGMFNEYLGSEWNIHKQALEALGSMCSVQDTEDQLSGIGFSSTKRAELVVKVKGETERIMKIKF